MATVAVFLQGFPEFQGVPTPQIQFHMNGATAQVDPAFWGGKTDDGIYFLTAHRLALSPWGMNARLAEPDKATTYWQHYDALRAQVAPGVAVL